MACLACAIKSPTRLGVGFKNEDAQFVPQRHRTIFLPHWSGASFELRKRRSSCRLLSFP